MEARHNKTISSPISCPNQADSKYVYRPHSGILQKTVENGIVIIAGDCHYEPGYIPTMHKAIVLLCKELKPKGVILNGDIVDLAALSHFDNRQVDLALFYDAKLD